MKVALVNPNWTFEGSIYFGCREPHLPIEFGMARQLLEREGHQVLTLDGHMFDLSDDDEPDEEAYDTIGGFVVHRIGRIPLPHTELGFRDGVRLVVEAAEPRRVAKVVASMARPPDDRDEANGGAPEQA